MDKLNRFSNEQELTDSAASTEYIDQLAAGDAVGDELELHVNVDTALTGGTSVNFKLQTDSAVGFGTVETKAESGAIVAADLVAGYKWRIRLPKGMKQYIRVYYTIVGTFSAGAVSAHLVPASDVSIND